MINSIIWNCNGVSASKLLRLRNLAAYKKANLIVLTESHQHMEFRMRGWKTISTEKTPTLGSK